MKTRLMKFLKNLKLEIECGSGTYIRSIGRDIAYKLNSLAHMTSLVRTKIDQFNLDNCYDVKEINTDTLNDCIINIYNVLSYETIQLSEEQTKKVLNGQTIHVKEKNGWYKLNNNADTVAIVKIEDFKAKMMVFLG